jgi:hypothetical protein
VTRGNAWLEEHELPGGPIDWETIELVRNLTKKLAKQVARSDRYARQAHISIAGE